MLLRNYMQTWNIFIGTYEEYTLMGTKACAKEHQLPWILLSGLMMLENDITNVAETEVENQQPLEVNIHHGLP